MNESVHFFSNIPGLPEPRGPFSQAVAASGRILQVAGQGPYDPDLKRFVRGSIAEQTRLTLACIQRAIEAAGATATDVLSCRVYLQPLDKQTFTEMNAVYAEFFGDHRPIRTTIGCQLLEIDVEIDCVVRLSK